MMRASDEKTYTREDWKGDFSKCIPDNFYVCPQCGQAVDMRDLGQVFHHEEPGHKPIDSDA
jgi:hypothetical protein